MTYEQAETLFNRIRYGGELKLVSPDLSVDARIKYDYGVQWVSFKFPEQKSYRSYRLMSKDTICTYIAQFDMEVASG